MVESVLGVAPPCLLAGTGQELKGTENFVYSVNFSSYGQQQQKPCMYSSIMSSKVVEAFGSIIVEEPQLQVLLF